MGMGCEFAAKSPLGASKTIGPSVAQEHLKLETPHRVRPGDSVEAVFRAKDDGRPVLVFDGDDDGTRPLLGLVMPFDVL